MKRMFWLGLGVIAGATGTVWAERKVKERLDALSPDSLAVAAGHRAKAAGRSVVAAVAEGRGAMREREWEMRTERGWSTPVRGPEGRDLPGSGRPSSHRPQRAARHR